MRCPKDGSACCDDLCHGGGCLEMNGYPMLAECNVCGGTIDEEIPDCGTCTCDDYEDIGNGPWCEGPWCEDCGMDWSQCKCSLDCPSASSNTTLDDKMSSKQHEAEKSDIASPPEAQR